MCRRRSTIPGIRLEVAWGEYFSVKGKVGAAEEWILCLGSDGLMSRQDLFWLLIHGRIGA